MNGKLEDALLSIVIPVWNEEEAIAQVLRNAQEAIVTIPKKEPRIRGLEVLVVDDGSADRTRDIVRGFEGIKLLSLEHAGYGAALKRGFEEAGGEILAFMDGDATCDPCLFGTLSAPVLSGEADLVNGNRLHARSKIPPFRYFGNWVIAKTMALLSGKEVRDGCSGMRVFHRSLLPILGDLPDDLSFSPGLTVAVLFSDSLRLAEVPIDYKERLGRSKLSVLKDTGRFFNQAFIAYRRKRRLARGQKNKEPVEKGLFQ